ncbi:MAG: HDOD domain-containing protein [Pseudomonadales bacterium]|nr:HDOD domain-containing protein [Pseudomonadales bacterium]
MSQSYKDIQIIDAKKTILADITAELKDGSIELPSLPDIALEIRAAISDEDKTFADIGKLIKHDPGLCAYLIKVSNSVAYCRGTESTSINSSLNRLGLETAKNLTSSYALKSLFVKKSQSISAMLKNVWKKDVHTGALGTVLASHCKMNPDIALMAGLLQDIGALPLINKLHEHAVLTMPDQRKDTQNFVDQYSRKISVYILKQWKFDPEIIEAVENRENWQYQHEGEANITDLILVARQLSYHGSEQFKTLPDIAGLDCYQKLGLGKDDGSDDDDQSLIFIQQAQEEINEIKNLLS